MKLALTSFRSPPFRRAREMDGITDSRREPKFKRCKITEHQLNVLTTSFGAPPATSRAF